MKISEVKQLLTEGVRFGNREKRMVERFSNDVLLGFEFEFMVKDITPDMDDYEINEKLYEIYENKAYDIYLSNENEFKEANEIGLIAEELVSKYKSKLDTELSKDELEAIAEETKSRIEPLISDELLNIRSISLVMFGDFDMIEELNRRLDEIDGEYEPIELHNVLNDVYYVLNDMVIYKMYTEEEIIKKIINKFERDETFHINTFVISQYNLIQQIISNSHGEQYPEDWATRMIEEADINGHYSNDLSVDVEVVHEKERFKDAIESLKRGLKWMRDTEEVYTIGNETQGTGLHCNVSIRNELFTESNINKLKLVMLMQERRIDKHFDPRKHVASMLSTIAEQITYHDWIDLINAKAFGKMDAFISILESKVPSKKYQRINFGHLAEDMDRRRIEFRFPGGKDYEYKEREIIDWCYRMVYMTMAAYSDDFGRKEYLKELVKFVDEKLVPYAFPNFDLDTLVEFYSERGRLPTRDENPD